MAQDGTRASDDAESSSTAASPRKAGPDEVYCTSCGVPIKKEADICPDCGVGQNQTDESAGSDDSRETSPDAGNSISDRRQYELEKIASKSTTSVMLWGFFVTPVAYLKLGKTGLAVLNFVTLNYLLLGFLVVPFHARKMITDAREELRRAGVAGY